MTEKPLRAYVISEDYEGNCSIQFATNGAAARRDGANELNMEFEDVQSCRREPRFDQYAPGPVPLQATLAAGWRHSCCGCEGGFDIDGRDDEFDRDDEFEPVSDGQHHHYCSPACMMMAWQERRQRERQESAVIEACQITYPEASQIRAYRAYRSPPAAARRVSEWHCTFKVPGLKYNVEWALGDTHVYVSPDDVDAWNRLHKSKQP